MLLPHFVGSFLQTILRRLSGQIFGDDSSRCRFREGMSECAIGSIGRDIAVQAIGASPEAITLSFGPPISILMIASEFPEID